MMARACVFRDLEVWMRMDPGRGAGDVAQIRSKLHRSRERDGQGIRVYTSAHTYSLHRNHLRGDASSPARTPLATVSEGSGHS